MNKFVVEMDNKEYVELPDGKIDAIYLYMMIYPKLIMKGISTDNILLADDYDNDGLTLSKEYEYDTNPFMSDSDKDGLCDYDEIIVYQSDPCYEDTDQDGMSDGTEISAGLNPLKTDSDEDGLPDSEETVTQEVRIGRN